MTALWIGLTAAAVFLIGLAFVPCPGCEARRARIKDALKSAMDKKAS